MYIRGALPRPSKQDPFPATGTEISSRSRFSCRKMVVGGPEAGEGEKNTLPVCTPGKAAILALGKSFPHQLVIQEYLVDGYFKNTNCDDLYLKQKLARLCNKPPSLSSIDLFCSLFSLMNLMLKKFLGVDRWFHLAFGDNVKH